MIHLPQIIKQLMNICFIYCVVSYEIVSIIICFFHTYNNKAKNKVEITLFFVEIK